MSEEEMEALNRQLAAIVGQQNHAAHADFAGLNSHQVHQLLYSPLEAGCVLQWQDELPQEDLQDIPFLRLVLLLLKRLATKEIKLTSKGNLPLALVQEMCDVLAESSGYLRNVKIKSEDDLPVVTGVKFLLDKAGYTKKRNGKLSLTAKGTKILRGDPAVILKTLFQLAFTEYNLEYAAHAYIPDGVPADGRLQRFTGYVLYLLLKHGTDWRSIEDYVSDLLRAFPRIRQEFPGSARFSTEFLVSYSFSSTFTNGLLGWFGLARTRKVESATNPRGANEMMGTDRFRRFFRFVPDAERPERPEEDADIQLRTALFDAEMGSSSWTSNDIDPAVQQAFHEQIRAFHAAESAGRVSIGSLMKGVKTVDPDKLPNEGATISLIQELLQAMMKRNIYFPPPMQIPPHELYRFIVTDLYAHEIPKPAKALPAFVPFEAVKTDLQMMSDYAFAAELFLLALFNLEEPFNEELFAPRVRVGSAFVARSKGVAKVEAWRSGWSKIVSLSFAPGPDQDGGNGTVFQFVEVTYQGIRRNGKVKNFDGAGVVQLLHDKEGNILVQGAQFGDFEL